MKGETGARSVTRREALVFGVAAVGLSVSAIGGRWVYQQRHADVPLHAETVAYASAEQRVLVTDASLVESDSRISEGTNTDEPRQRMEAFMRTAAPWLRRVPPAHRELARGALLDLWVLSDGLPATVAGWSPRWRYIWPRDAAFCAAALARVGHLDTAVAQLTHLQTLQSSDGWFEARYVPRTTNPPDARATQFDSTGLAAWAIADVRATAAARHDPLGNRLDPMLALSYRTLTQATDDGRRLPDPSPDFWEVPEPLCTIGIAACTLSGLVAAGDLLKAPAAAERFRSVVSSTFAARGFERYGSRGGSDAGAAFLDATGVHGLTTTATLRRIRRALERPAGGIAPGASWKDDGISWTPATSLLGLAMARAGDRDGAIEILRWVDEHRTEAGSIPEKVLYDGSPAAEAPLAWSAANVLLMLDALAA